MILIAAHKNFKVSFLANVNAYFDGPSRGSVVEAL